MNDTLMLEEDLFRIIQALLIEDPNGMLKIQMAVQAASEAHVSLWKEAPTSQAGIIVGS